MALLEDEDLARLDTPAVSEVVMLVRAGLLRAAYGRLLDLLAGQPGGPALQLLAGDLASRLGETDLAPLHYRTALAMEPASAPALAGLGRALLRAGEPEEARRTLEAAVAADPAQASAWSNLGVVRRMAGEPVPAEQAYRRALVLDPSLSEAWYNLGWLMVQQGRPAEAIQVLRRGLAVAPEDCDIRRLLAAHTMSPEERLRLVAPCRAAGPTAVSAAPPATPAAVASPDRSAPRRSAR